MNAIELQDITVRVKPHFWSATQTILDQLSLEVSAGSTVGVIGPNGAGKTTAIKVLLGLLKPHTGTIQVLGGEITSPEVRRRLGYAPERTDFPARLSAIELAVHHGRLAGLQISDAKRRAAEVVELVGLGKDGHRPLGTYSKGMQQRANIAQCLVGHPDLVVLDEPMSGLDPLGRHDVREVIQRLRDKGTTVFFATHILSDVETICDHVVLIVNGTVRRRGQLHELRPSSSAKYRIVAVDCTDVMLSEVEKFAHEVTSQPPNHVISAVGRENANAIAKALLNAGAQVASIESRTDLESLFLEEAERGRK